jgi:outer membrane receptor protein involved in Fe transport
VSQINVRRVALTTLLVVSAEIAVAQRTIATEGAPALGQPITSAAMAIRVTLSADGISLREALNQLARGANVRILFRLETVAAVPPVTLRLVNVPLGQALERVLAGTGMQAVPITPTAIAIKPVSGTAQGQEGGTLVGKITDAKNGRPLAGARVSVDTDLRGVLTSDDGSYRIAGVVAGSHTIVVKLVGYGRQTRTVRITDGETVTQDVRLDASTNMLDQIVVTGTVIPTELRAIPNAMTVITAKQIEERGITRIDQLFRGDVPGVFAINQGANPSAALDEVAMFSRGATALAKESIGALNDNDPHTNPIKVYVDGIEAADAKYLSQIDARSIERIEILTGPQASTIYGSNAINGVMQIFTKRGATNRPQLTLNLLSGWVENNFSNARTPQHDYSAQLNGIEGRLGYSAGGSWNYMGPWTPGKQTSRLGGFGGVRFDLPTAVGKVTADLMLRRSGTQTRQRSSLDQVTTSARVTGFYTNTSSPGLERPLVRTLAGQTIGLALSYSPISSWSHELSVGSDVSETEHRVTARGYTTITDTTLFFSQSHSDRRSIRYATTARIPIAALVQLTVTAGADSWQNLVSSLNASSQTLTGSLTTVTNVSRRPGHNAGGFLQSQLALRERLFFTYGLRVEKNPTIGEKARVTPGRYGVAYTHELGAITAKMRGSYGRSIRPPAPTLKEAVPQFGPVLNIYGNYDLRLANAELVPEHQQGGEGGIELYLGNRGSLVVTRYNQTVDQLIALVAGVDSVTSLRTLIDLGNNPAQFPQWTDGYAHARQSQNLNLGSIRNQGWEIQGNMNLGPLTTRGTYSWTKSRVIGITPKYRPFFVNKPEYQPGAMFQFLPEHTWAFGVTYARAASSIALNVTGLGQVFNRADDFSLEHLSNNIRLLQNQLNMSAVNAGRYVSINSSYALADLIVSHRFSPRIEALLQLSNLTDRYTNDLAADYASIGRQVKAGWRVRTQ